jgi:hypothetical protein
MKTKANDDKRCFMCNKEVTAQTGRAIIAATGVPTAFIQQKPGDGFICNECDSVTSSEIIRRDWMKKYEARQK